MDEEILAGVDEFLEELETTNIPTDKLRYLLAAFARDLYKDEVVIKLRTLSEDYFVYEEGQ